LFVAIIHVNVFNNNIVKRLFRIPLRSGESIHPGQFWKCCAAAIGQSPPKVEALLVKGLSPPNSTADVANTTTSAAANEKDKDRALTQDAAIQLVVESVQSVIPKESQLFGLVVSTGNTRGP
jgi:hypothetical protein